MYIAWVPKIIESLEQGQTFVAAGVLHFFGEDNVLKILEKKGFKVTRVLWN